VDAAVMYTTRILEINDGHSQADVKCKLMPVVITTIATVKYSAMKSPR